MGYGLSTMSYFINHHLRMYLPWAMDYQPWTFSSTTNLRMYFTMGYGLSTMDYFINHQSPHVFTMDHELSTMDFLLPSTKTSRFIP